ncbi:hypothetical protein BH23CHL8_BH23CHL8_07930 [soil metagenome]
MKGSPRVAGRRIAATFALPAVLMLSLVPPAASETPAAAHLDGGIPRCDAPAGAPRPRAASSRPLSFEVVLDDDGVVVGHRLVLPNRVVELGPRAFVSEDAVGRVLVGERAEGSTHVVLVDGPRGCSVWSRTLDDLAYDVELEEDGRSVRFMTVDRLDRRYAGRYRLDMESGQTTAMIEGQCNTACEPNDGEVDPAAYLPVSEPRPVPVFAAGGWPRDTSLPFRWHSGAVPPDWAKDALNKGAADVTTTSRSRAPSFEFRSGADETVRYTASFPTFCRYGIACAWRDMPVWWTVFIRPHGTDFSWGILRWCQKHSADGCFDLRRVMIHELGHIVGLDHPENHGFRLGSDDSVMQAITPARPSAGSARHSFGRCDVAALQRVYDVPDNKAAISRCLDLATDLGLAASSNSVKRGSTVLFTATLTIQDRDGYGALGGNPLNGRAVKLRYRAAGSAADWSSAWMESTSKLGRYQLELIPQGTWEYEAVFPDPADEGLRMSRSSTLKVVVKET